jgi:hypothetical protein
MSATGKTRGRVEIFSSFEDENRAEYRRRAKMTPEERLAELSALQEQAWGKQWAEEPFVRVATWEKMDW